MEKTKALSLLEFIESNLNAGRTIVLSTYGRNIQVTPKTVKRFKAAQIALFKIDTEGSLRIASGKNYNIICTKTTSLVVARAL